MAVHEVVVEDAADAADAESQATAIMEALELSRVFRAGWSHTSTVQKDRTQTTDDGSGPVTTVIGTAHVVTYSVTRNE